MITGTGVSIIVLSNLLIYWRTLKYWLVSDDMPAHRKTLAIKEAKPDKKFHFWEGLYYDIRGVYNIRRSHVISLAIHIACCVLMYLAFGNLWAALLFSFNPITLMASTWLSGKAYSLVTALALASFVIPSNAVLFYAIAVYWNISALLYPLAFPFVFNTWWGIALVFMVLPATFWRFTAKPEHVSLSGTETTKIKNESNVELRALRPRKVIIALKTFGYYFFDTLFCFRLGLFHTFLYTYGLRKEDNARCYALTTRRSIKYGKDKKKELSFRYINGEIIRGLLAFAITIVGIRYGSLPVALGLFWFAINVGMWLNLVTFNQQIAERYLYLPAVGLMLALGTVANEWVCSLFLVFYLTRLWWFMPSMINEYWNVEYNLHEAKDLYYIWISRGVHRYGDGNHQDAVRNFLQAFRMKPNDYKVNNNLFYIGLILNDMTLAKKHLELASKCVVDGKEQEIANMVKHGTELVNRIEEGIKKDGKAQVDLKEMKILL